MLNSLFLKYHILIKNNNDIKADIINYIKAKYNYDIEETNIKWKDKKLEIILPSILKARIKRDNDFIALINKNNLNLD